MIKAGLPVFFGCDVGKFSDKETGIMDTALFDYEVTFFTPVCSRGLICCPSECLRYSPGIDQGRTTSDL